MELRYKVVRVSESIERKGTDKIEVANFVFQEDAALFIENKNECIITDLQRERYEGCVNENATNCKNVLVIAPHSDDAELALGGTIAKLVSQGHKVSVLVMVVKDDKLLARDKVVTGNERLNEFVSSMSILGVKDCHVMYSFEFNNFDICSQSKSEVVSKLDELTARLKVDWLFLPTPSYHQEHQFCYECCIATSRPSRTDIKISKVFAYEYPGSVWTATTSIGGGRYYFDISDYLPTKVEALIAHKSQGLEGNSLVSIGAVEALATLRGYESGYVFAEMVYLLRAFDS